MLHIDPRQVIGGHPLVNGIVIARLSNTLPTKKWNATPKLLNPIFNNMLVFVCVGIISYYLLIKSSIMTKVKDIFVQYPYM